MATTINIDHLSENELSELNHKVVARLKIMREVKTHHSMLKFGIGDRVYAEYECGSRMEGIISKFNRKTVTIVSEDGARWNIPPSCLKPVRKGIEDIVQSASNVISLPVHVNSQMGIGNQGGIGRNSPCPCGSGEKYKKCCLRK